MRMYDIIHKKRDGFPLTDEEISFVVQGCTDGSIPDYQLSALMMAIYFQGLDPHETAVLTDRMAHSGDLVDLSGDQGSRRISIPPAAWGQDHYGGGSHCGSLRSAGGEDVRAWSGTHRRHCG